MRPSVGRTCPTLAHSLSSYYLFASFALHPSSFIPVSLLIIVFIFSYTVIPSCFLGYIFISTQFGFPSAGRARFF
jgi:hypothetical protein